MTKSNYVVTIDNKIVHSSEDFNSAFRKFNKKITDKKIVYLDFVVDNDWDHSSTYTIAINENTNDIVFHNEATNRMEEIRDL